MSAGSVGVATDGYASFRLSHAWQKLYQAVDTLATGRGGILERIRLAQLSWVGLTNEGWPPGSEELRSTFHVVASLIEGCQDENEAVAIAEKLFEVFRKLYSYE
jgi:hypothetical protein